VSTNCNISAAKYVLIPKLRRITIASFMANIVGVVSFLCLAFTAHPEKTILGVHHKT